MAKCNDCGAETKNIYGLGAEYMQGNPIVQLL